MKTQRRWIICPRYSATKCLEIDARIRVSAAGIHRCPNVPLSLPLHTSFPPTPKLVSKNETQGRAHLQPLSLEKKWELHPCQKSPLCRCRLQNVPIAWLAGACPRCVSGRLPSKPIGEERTGKAALCTCWGQDCTRRRHRAQLSFTASNPDLHPGAQVCQTDISTISCRHFKPQPELNPPRLLCFLSSLAQ